MGLYLLRRYIFEAEKLSFNSSYGSNINEVLWTDADEYEAYLKRFRPLSEEAVVDVARIKHTESDIVAKYDKFAPTPLPEHVQLISQKFNAEFGKISKGMQIYKFYIHDEKRGRQYNLASDAPFLVESKAPER